MIVERETATVYRGGGRRYFTKRAAYVSAARAKIDGHCECLPAEPDVGLDSMVCRLHSDLRGRLIDQLVEIYRREDSATRGAA